MSSIPNTGYGRPPMAFDAAQQKSSLILRLANISAYVTLNLSPSPNLVELDSLLTEVENKARSLYLATVPVKFPKQPFSYQTSQPDNGLPKGPVYPGAQLPAGLANPAASHLPADFLQAMRPSQFLGNGQSGQMGQPGQPGQVSPTSNWPYRSAVYSSFPPTKPEPFSRDGLYRQERNGKHLEDYQMQLMLLERQNRKRLLMAREEYGNPAPTPVEPSVQGSDFRPISADATEAKPPSVCKEPAKPSEDTDCPKPVSTQTCESMRQARRQEIRARRLEKLERECGEQQKGDGEETEKGEQLPPKTSGAISTPISQPDNTSHVPSEPKSLSLPCTSRPPPDHDALGQACLSLSRLSHRLPEANGVKASRWDAGSTTQRELKIVVDDILREVQKLRTRKLAMACRYRKDLHGKADAVKRAVKHLHALDALNLVTIASICQGYANVPARDDDRGQVSGTLLPLARRGIAQLPEWKTAFDKVEEALNEAEITCTTHDEQDFDEEDLESEESSAGEVDDDDFLVVGKGERD